MFGWFNKRFDQPIEHRNYSALYALLSLVLFIGTLGAVYNEVDSRRPWKDYQEDYRALKARVLEMRMREAQGAANADRIKALDKEVAKIDRQLGADTTHDAQRQVDRLGMQIRNVSQERANVKSEADNRNYLFEHARRERHFKDADDYRAERVSLEADMAALDSEIDSLTKVKDNIIARHLAPLRAKRLAAVNERDSLYKQYADLKTKLEETNAAPVKVRQVMIADVDRSNFGNVKVRVDRCQTCHMGIGDPVIADTSIFTKIGPDQVFRKKENAERMRKVFGPHPYPDMLLKHNVERFGCTNCHGGQSMSIDDVDHAHGLEAHWEQPMLTGGFVEGSCRKCHGGDYSFANGGAEMDWISKGRKLFVDLGCYACHEGPMVPDFKTYKVGPSLVDISKKVSPEWATRWIQDPSKWNEHTRMPNFKFDDKQTAAVVAYLFDKSADSKYQPVSAAAPAGDAARGRQTMIDIGCIACHTMPGFEPRGEFKFTRTSDTTSLWPNRARNGDRVAEGNNFGPDLTGVGSKVSAEWLYDWVRNPKHFSPESRMPIMRLTDGEASDITSYLMTQKKPGFTTGVQRVNTTDPALIKQGEGLIREYGCFGCHTIEGMENESKVSVPLDDFGRKTGADLFFGYVSSPQLFSVRHHYDTTKLILGKQFEHIHRGEDWFNWTILKLKNPRIYATDVIPQKMPVFNMTDEEAYALTVLLRSQVKSYIPTTFVYNRGSVQPAVDDGRFLTHWNNCVGCHTIENQGGFVRENLRKVMKLEGDDILPYAPPSLNTLGAKLQEPWFYAFVKDPGSYPVRPWLKIRMPTYAFTTEEITRLDRYFLGLEGRSLAFTDYSSNPATEESVAAGRELFTRLKCQQCHAVGSTPSNGGETAVPTPNLAMAGNRLQPDWIARWVADPQAIVPGTKMPNFFGTIAEPAAPFKDILGGDRQRQLEALRDYVWRLGGPKGNGNSQIEAGPSMTPAAPAAPTDTASAPTISSRSTRGKRSLASR
ncbi:MAG: c-type cytochrome [bacterium]|nr:c-type cytochrome [Candidatus Kapabacteria bacterium]